MTERRCTTDVLKTVSTKDSRVVAQEPDYQIPSGDKEIVVVTDSDLS